MEYTYKIQKEMAGSLDNNAVFKSIQRAGIQEDGLILVPKNLHQSTLIQALRDPNLEQSDIDTFAEFAKQCGNTEFAGFIKALGTHNSFVDNSKRVAKSETVQERARRQVYSRLKKFDAPVKEQISRLKPLQLANVGEKFKTVSNAQLKIWRKAHGTTVNGGCVLTWSKNSLALFNLVKIVFPQVPGPQNTLVRDVLVRRGFETGKYLMTPQDLASVAKRLQLYNVFHVPPLSVNAENIRTVLEVLRGAGYDVRNHLTCDFDRVKVNPQALVFGCSTYKDDGLNIDLRVGAPFKKVGKYAVREVKDFHTDKSFAYRDDILSTANHILVRGKLEVLAVEEVLHEDNHERSSGKVVKLMRTFGTGQNVRKMSESALLQPFQISHKVSSYERRARGERAGSISGITWDSEGIGSVMSYLVSGNSSTPITLEALSEARFVCLDRKKMEMTVNPIMRAVLAYWLRRSYSKCDLGKAVVSWVTHLWQEGRRHLVCMKGSGHWTLVGGAVVSGEPGTYLLDDIDNCYWLEKLSMRFPEPLMHVHGGDDGALCIKPEQYEDVLKLVEIMKEKFGVIWTDTELRKNLIINTSQLQGFLALETVTTLEGKPVSALTAHDDKAYFTIYGMIPVFVVDDSNYLFSFPLYKISKVLDSWWQPPSKLAGVASDVQASIRAAGMNNVIGMFTPINDMFMQWVEDHPIPEGPLDLPEFGDDLPEGLVLSANLKTSDEVLNAWTLRSAPQVGFTEAGDSWADIFDDLDNQDVTVGARLKTDSSTQSRIIKKMVAGQDIYRDLSSLDPADEKEVMAKGYQALERITGHSYDMKVAEFREIIVEWAASKSTQAVIKLNRQEEDGIGYWIGHTDAGSEVSVTTVPDRLANASYLWAFIRGKEHGVLGEPGVEVTVSEAIQTSDGYKSVPAEKSKSTQRKRTRFAKGKVKRGESSRKRKTLREASSQYSDEEDYFESFSEEEY